MNWARILAYVTGTVPLTISRSSLLSLQCI